MQAIWGEDYDFRTDSIFKRPCCPECCDPIGLDGSDKYRCYSCGEVVEVTDPEMLEWFEERKAVMYVNKDCPRRLKHRGSKGTMRVMYVKNNVTLEWQKACGKCQECGLTFMV